MQHITNFLGRFARTKIVSHPTNPFRLTLSPPAIDHPAPMQPGAIVPIAAVAPPTVQQQKPQFTFDAFRNMFFSKE